MEIEKIDKKTFLVTVKKSYLEKIGFDWNMFMAESDEWFFFIKKIKDKLIDSFGLNFNLREYITYLFKDKFYIYFKLESKKFEFETDNDFFDFLDFLSRTKYSDEFMFDNSTNEIYLSSDISSELLNLMKEFTK